MQSNDKIINPCFQAKGNATRWTGRHVFCSQKAGRATLARIPYLPSLDLT
jgi:hypothetical protein